MPRLTPWALVPLLVLLLAIPSMSCAYVNFLDDFDDGHKPQWVNMTRINGADLTNYNNDVLNLYTKGTTKMGYHYKRYISSITPPFEFHTRVKPSSSVYIQLLNQMAISSPDYARGYGTLISTDTSMSRVYVYDYRSTGIVEKKYISYTKDAEGYIVIKTKVDADKKVYLAVNDGEYVYCYTSPSTLFYPAIGCIVAGGESWTAWAYYDYAYIDPDPNPETGARAAFILELSSYASPVGDPITATLTPAADAPRYSEIAWTVTDPDGNADIELYTKPSPDYTSWTHYNKTSRTFEASTESAAHNLVFSPTGPGAWTVSAVIRDNQPPSTGAALASVSASCQVERKAGNVDVVISTYDGAYSSAHYLTGVGLTVWDLSRNATVLYDSTGSYLLGSSGTYNGLVTVSAPLGDEIRIKVEKSGYITSDFNTYVQPTALPLNQMPISITLMPAATPAPDQVYASFTVRSARGSPISGAAVVAGGHLASTDSNGYARVAIPYNETVAYTVSASGYGSISGYILPATSNTALTVTLYVASTTTPATTAPDGSSTPPARDPGDVIDSGVSIVLEFFEILVFMGCIATLAGFAALMGGRRR